MSRAYCKRVLHGFRAMIEAELNARRQDIGNLLAHLRREAFVNHISAKRQRQPVVLFSPPHAQIFAHNQPFILIRQLAFVNDQARRPPRRTDRVENLVERHDNVIEFLRRFPQP